MISSDTLSPYWRVILGDETLDDLQGVKSVMIAPSAVSPNLGWIISQSSIENIKLHPYTRLNDCWASWPWPSVQYLDISGSHSHAFSLIKQLPLLKTLLARECDATPLQDFTSHLTSLETLDLSASSALKVLDLSSLPSLRWVIIDAYNHLKAELRLPSNARIIEHTRPFIYEKEL